MASCCANECQVAESAASQIYNIDELLEYEQYVHYDNAHNFDSIITDDVISPARKFPFIRVLIWAYLITEMDSAAACSTLISTKYLFQFEYYNYE